MQGEAEFHGAKLILFIGSELVILRRDDIPTIPWPGRLDLPGGAREGAETVEACVLRETFEEIGLRLGPNKLRWRRRHGGAVYFAAHLPAGAERGIVFGSEGQGWSLMRPAPYLADPDVIPHHADLVRQYLSAG